MMVSAAQVEIIWHSGRISDLAAYVARSEARPAYKQAFGDQLTLHTGEPPTDRLIEVRSGLDDRILE